MMRMMYITHLLLLIIIYILYYLLFQLLVHCIAELKNVGDGGRLWWLPWHLSLFYVSLNVPPILFWSYSQTFVEVRSR